MSSIAPLGAEIQSLREALEHRAAGAPEALAFCAEDESLSYGRLWAEAETLAAGLARLGVESGVRVVLLIPAGLDFIRVFFALQLLGAVPCAFDPAAQAMAAGRAVRIRPRLVLTAGTEADGLAEACTAAGLRAVKLGAVPRSVKPPQKAGADGQALAFLQPTSGTTGEPRAAMVTQRNAIASLQSIRDLLELGPRDVLVSWVPPWHDLGLMRFVLGPVYFGAPCHLVPPAIQTLPLWLRKASEVRATVLGAPDFAYRLAARLVDPRGIDLSSLRYATNGGEPVRRSTIELFEERFGVPGVVRPGYGLAEATLGVTCLPPGEPLRVDGRGNVSCGRPIPPVEVRISGEPGQTGEILVRGPAVFAGYFDAEEATREVLREGWLRTGDVGRLDANGHLYVLGRERALLKRGGASLSPRELEEVAERVPGVRAAAAVGLPPGPDAATEEIVVALEADPQGLPADLAAAAAAAAAAVEEALGFAPAAVLVLAPRTIPRTRNGKIRYSLLQSAIQEGELDRAVLFSLRGARPPAETAGDPG